MEFIPIGIVAVTSAVWSYLLIARDRARLMAVTFAGVAAACLLIWAQAPGLPGIHGAALSSLALLWGMPFCFGAAAGAAAGWLRKPA